MENIVKKCFLCGVKKAFLLSLALCGSLYAMDDATFGVKFLEAQKAYDQKNYAQAYKNFDELFFERSDDTKVNFYLGRCALELKKYDDASSAFERVLMVEPGHIRSRMELARAYFEDQQLEQAEDEFLKALQYNIPPEVKSQIQLYLKAIGDSSKHSFFSGAVIIGFQHDTNVNAAIGDKYYTIPSGITLPGGKQKVDMSAIQALALNHTYNFSKKGGFYWQTSGILYGMTYARTPSSNVKLTGINSGLGYRADSFDILVPVATDRLEYGLLPFMYTTSVAPKFNYKITNTLLADISYTYKNKFYYYNNWSRNALSQEGVMGIKKILPSSGAMYSASVTYGRETERYADNKTGVGTIGRTDVNSYSRGFKLEYYRPLLKSVDMQIGYTLKQTGYSETDTLFFKPKTELARTYSLGLFKKIDKTSLFNLTLSTVGNESNFDTSTYRKNTTVLNYIKSF